jgi:histidine phosphotransferase ChpT
VSAFDLRLAEMLASRLCHDLVNPIGAVANGAELLSEFSDLSGVITSETERRR